MGRKGTSKAAVRQSRKELFSAEELSLEWREMRKAVSGGGSSSATGPLLRSKRRLEAAMQSTDG